MSLEQQLELVYIGMLQRDWLKAKFVLAPTLHQLKGSPRVCPRFILTRPQLGAGALLRPLPTQHNEEAIQMGFLILPGCD